MEFFFQETALFEWRLTGLDLHTAMCLQPEHIYNSNVLAPMGEDTFRYLTKLRRPNLMLGKKDAILDWAMHTEIFEYRHAYKWRMWKYSHIISSLRLNLEHIDYVNTLSTNQWSKVVTHYTKYRAPLYDHVHKSFEDAWTQGLTRIFYELEHLKRHDRTTCHVVLRTLYDYSERLFFYYPFQTQVADFTDWGVLSKGTTSYDRIYIVLHFYLVYLIYGLFVYFLFLYPLWRICLYLKTVFYAQLWGSYMWLEPRFIMFVFNLFILKQDLSKLFSKRVGLTARRTFFWLDFIFSVAHYPQTIFTRQRSNEKKMQQQRERHRTFLSYYNRFSEGNSYFFFVNYIKRLVNSILYFFFFYRNADVKRDYVGADAEEKWDFKTYFTAPSVIDFAFFRFYITKHVLTFFYKCRSKFTKLYQLNIISLLYNLFGGDNTKKFYLNPRLNRFGFWDIWKYVKWLLRAIYSLNPVGIFNDAERRKDVERILQGKHKATLFNTFMLDLRIKFLKLMFYDTDEILFTAEQPDNYDIFNKFVHKTFYHMLPAHVSLGSMFGFHVSLEHFVFRTKTFVVSSLTFLQRYFETFNLLSIYVVTLVLYVNKIVLLLSPRWWGKINLSLFYNNLLTLLDQEMLYYLCYNLYFVIYIHRFFVIIFYKFTDLVFFLNYYFVKLIQFLVVSFFLVFAIKWEIHEVVDYFLYNINVQHSLFSYVEYFFWFTAETFLDILHEMVDKYQMYCGEIFYFPIETYDLDRKYLGDTKSRLETVSHFRRYWFYLKAYMKYNYDIYRYKNLAGEPHYIWIHYKLLKDPKVPPFMDYGSFYFWYKPIAYYVGMYGQFLFYFPHETCYVLMGFFVKWLFDWGFIIGAYVNDFIVNVEDLVELCVGASILIAPHLLDYWCSAYNTILDYFSMQDWLTFNVLIHGFYLAIKIYICAMYGLFEPLYVEFWRIFTGIYIHIAVGLNAVIHLFKYICVLVYNNYKYMYSMTLLQIRDYVYIIPGYNIMLNFQLLVEDLFRFIIKAIRTTRTANVAIDDWGLYLSEMPNYKPFWRRLPDLTSYKGFMRSQPVSRYGVTTESSMYDEIYPIFVYDFSHLMYRTIVEMKFFDVYNYDWGAKSIWSGERSQFLLFFYFYLFLVQRFVFFFWTFLSDKAWKLFYDLPYFHRRGSYTIREGGRSGFNSQFEDFYFLMSHQILQSMKDYHLIRKRLLYEHKIDDPKMKKEMQVAEEVWGLNRYKDISKWDSYKMWKNDLFRPEFINRAGATYEINISTGGNLSELWDNQGWRARGVSFYDSGLYAMVRRLYTKNTRYTRFLTHFDSHITNGNMIGHKEDNDITDFYYQQFYWEWLRLIMFYKLGSSPEALQQFKSDKNHLIFLELLIQNNLFNYFHNFSDKSDATNMMHYMEPSLNEIIKSEHKSWWDIASAEMSYAMDSYIFAEKETPKMSQGFFDLFNYIWQTSRSTFGGRFPAPLVGFFSYDENVYVDQKGMMYYFEQLTDTEGAEIMEFLNVGMPEERMFDVRYYEVVKEQLIEYFQEKNDPSKNEYKFLVTETYGNMNFSHEYIFYFFIPLFAFGILRLYAYIPQEPDYYVPFRTLTMMRDWVFDAFLGLHYWYLYYSDSFSYYIVAEHAWLIRFRILLSIAPSVDIFPSGAEDSIETKAGFLLSLFPDDWPKYIKSYPYYATIWNIVDARSEDYHILKLRNIYMKEFVAWYSMYEADATLRMLLPMEWSSWLFFFRFSLIFILLFIFFAYGLFSEKQREISKKVFVRRLGFLFSKSKEGR